MIVFTCIYYDHIIFIAGVITYDSQPRAEFYLNTYNNKSSIREALTLSYTGRGSNPEAAVCFISEVMFLPEHTSGDKDKNIAIVISDGGSTNRYVSHKVLYFLHPRVRV